MSVRKLDYTLNQRDPEKVAQLKAVIDEMWPLELQEYRALREPVRHGVSGDPTKRITDNSGKDWIRQASANETASINRDNRKVAKLRLLTQMLDVVITPRDRKESDQVEDDAEDQRAAVRELLTRINKGQNTPFLDELDSQTEGRLNVPVPQSVQDKK